MANYLFGAIVDQALFWGFNLALLFGAAKAVMTIKEAIHNRRVEARRKRWEF